MALERPTEEAVAVEDRADQEDQRAVAVDVEERALAVGAEPGHHAEHGGEDRGKPAASGEPEGDLLAGVEAWGPARARGGLLGPEQGERGERDGEEAGDGHVAG